MNIGTVVEDGEEENKIRYILDTIDIVMMRKVLVTCLTNFIS